MEVYLLADLDVGPAYKDLDRSVLHNWPCKLDVCYNCESSYYSDRDQYHECKLYDRALPDAEAENVIGSLVANIRASRESLSELNPEHGDLLASRWKKRSKDKREAILRQAEPDLPDEIGSMFYLTQSQGGKYDWHLSRTSKFRLATMLPYLSISVLKDNVATLFALLHYRTQYAPQAFAAYDMYQMRIPWGLGLFAANFSPLCVRAYGAGYGHVESFNTEKMHRGDLIGFPMAQLTLEAQSRLLRMLLRIGHGILDGADLGAHSSQKWRALCDDGFRASGDLAQWSTYTNQPFSGPPVLDIEDIISTARLRFNDIADNLGMLQTDPSYLRRDTLATSKDRVQQGRALPAEYDRALAAFELVLVNLLNQRGETFLNSAQQRPGFSKYFILTPKPNNMLEIRKNFIGPLADRLADDPMFWCITNISAKPDTVGSCDHAHLFAFLEAHLQKTTEKQRARLDQVILDQLADIAANHQLLQAVRLGRPQNSIGTASKLKNTETRRAWRDWVSRPASGIFTAAHRERGVLLKGFYDTSSPSGKRDANWVQQSLKLHLALRTYWDAVRKAFPVPMAHDEFRYLLRADDDPVHVQALLSEHQVILDEDALRNKMAETSLHDAASIDTPQSSFKASETKTKTKTRATHVVADDDGEPDPVALEDMTQPVAAVSATKRALEELHRMFPTDAETSAKGVSWDAFVLAMQDLGFRARNGAGSAVVFDAPSKGRIVFHKPHPEPKLDAVLLRANGKRMAQWFGWCREMFTPL